MLDSRKAFCRSVLRLGELAAKRKRHESEKAQVYERPMAILWWHPITWNRSATVNFIQGNEANPGVLASESLECLGEPGSGIIDEA